MNKKRAFTLIELLVVVSIISLLSSVVLASLNAARTKARISKARQEMLQFAKAVAVAQGESNKTLVQISAGSGSNNTTCSRCSCSGVVSGTSGACYTNWIAVRNAVQTNTNGVVTGLTNMDRDPWGSPYGIDENEGEGGANDCRQDGIMSYGPDGATGGGDDFEILIPLKKNPCP
ncbi:MAG: prepilin-type N-terminal cleavage/methylation domain-containing protein [Candidatus Taylorbacteria bacterium]|nr:prepilin-type N-terminal cleavage/methylation domain-containing protein [Candidatus Taylorbacteria bacterium]